MRALVLGIIVLVAFHWLISWIGQRSAAFSVLIKGYSTVVVRDGKALPKEMEDAHMSRDDLDEDLREKGVDAVADVAEARLERSGKLSVIKK
jgi:uncharacterized membrane protein YcaP (DUF421 family)